jgi:hypothetical protein
MSLRRSTRKRRSAISNDYIVFLQENEFNIGMMEDDHVTLRHALESVNSHKWTKAIDEEKSQCMTIKSGISSLYLNV